MSNLIKAMAVNDLKPLSSNASSQIGNVSKPKSSVFKDMVNQVNQLAQQGHHIESSLEKATLGEGGLEHVAQDIAEFSVQIEAVKNIVDASSSAVKSLINTPL